MTLLQDPELSPELRSALEARLQKLPAQQEEPPSTPADRAQEVVAPLPRGQSVLRGIVGATPAGAAEIPPTPPQQPTDPGETLDLDGTKVPISSLNSEQVLDLFTKLYQYPSVTIGQRVKLAQHLQKMQKAESAGAAPALAEPGAKTAPIAGNKAKFGAAATVILGEKSYRIKGENRKRRREIHQALKKYGKFVEYRFEGDEVKVYTADGIPYEKNGKQVTLEAF